MLPLGFTELEWLQSTRTQYIDTGIIPKTGIIADIKFNFASLPKCCIFGSYNPRDYFGTSSSKKFLCASGGNYRYGINDLEINIDYRIIYGFYDGYAEAVTDNFETIRNNYSASPTQSNPAALFARRDSAAAVSYYFNGKIYYCKITDNNILLRSFIPALRNSDGETGMFDEVTGTFFTNQGTGKFVAGPKVAVSSGKEIISYYPSTDIEGETTIIGTPSPTSPATIISKEPYGLNKVGTYADEYLLNGGTVDGIVVPPKGILRRVGVKVLDGTENWVSGNNYIKSDAFNSYIVINDIKVQDKYDTSNIDYCTHFNQAHVSIYSIVGYPNMFVVNNNQLHLNIANSVLGITDYTQETVDSAKEKFKAYLADQYAKGTPVTVYYPLATPIIEQPHMVIVPSFKSLVFKNRLPEGYERVEYIESHGTEYIDSGIPANTLMDKITFKTELNGTGTLFCGEGTVNTGTGFRIYNFISDDISTFAKINSHYFQIHPTDIHQNQFFDCEIIKTESGLEVYIDGIKLTAVSETIGVANSSSIYIFAMNRNGSIQRTISAKLSYLCFENQGTLLRDFIPCKHNNEYGLYDLVTKQFFTNQGTGAFTGGPVIQDLTPVTSYKSIIKL